MSIINQLMDENSSCTEILAIMLNFSPLESLLYFHLLQSGQKTVNQLCKDTSRKQSTIHIALQKLVTYGICLKKKKNRNPRGYEYIYAANKPLMVKSLLRQRLERLYEYTSQCIDSFDKKAPTCEISFS